MIALPTVWGTVTIGDLELNARSMQSQIDNLYEENEDLLKQVRSLEKKVLAPQSAERAEPVIAKPATKKAAKKTAKRAKPAIAKPATKKAAKKAANRAEPAIAKPATKKASKKARA